MGAALGRPHIPFASAFGLTVDRLQGLTDMRVVNVALKGASATLAERPSIDHSIKALIVSGLA